MKKKIVVAEDDLDLLHMLMLVLKAVGHEVTCFKDGVAIVNNQCALPDLFIIDIQMAFIDGFALCKYLKLNDRTKEVPVILMSGIHEHQTRAFKAGADYFLSKPFSMKEILKVIDTFTSSGLLATRAR